jgi:nucleoside-diphosphate-sugar epimerase
VQHVLGDRLHLFDFKREFERIAPQVVLDMIPYTEQDVQDVIKTFKGIAWRVVAISSQDVYRAYDVFRQLESGPIEPIPLTEDSPLRDRLYPFRGLLERPFDRSDDYEKILIERVVMTNPDLAGTIVRLPMVYGSGDFRHRLFPLLKRMDEQRPAIVLEESFARWQGCHGYVKNVAYAIVLAVTQDQASGRIYNVAEPSAVSEAERIRAIRRIAGWQGEVLVVPKSQMPESWELPYNTTQA